MVTKFELLLFFTTCESVILDIQCNNENRLRHLTQAICSKFLSVKQMSIAENRITAGTLR